MRHSGRLVAWTCAVAAVSALYTAFWPVFEAETLRQLTEELPAGLVEALGYDRMTTPHGWLTTTVHGLLGPLLLLVFGIGFGARSVHRDELDGVIALELMQPVQRSAPVVGRLVAAAAQLTTLAFGLTLATIATAAIVGMAVTVADLVGAGAALLVFSLPWMALSWALAAGVGRRDVAVGATSALAVASYVVHVVGSATGRPGLSRWSPFHLYLDTDPVAAGLDATWASASVVVTLVVVGFGVVGFGGRDIGP